MFDGKTDGTRVTLLGLGNVAMGDDGVGIVVARRLESLARDLGVRIVEGGMAGMGLVRHFMDSDALVVVDAIDTGASEPGSIFRFDPDAVGVTQLRSNNIHGMGLPHLLTNARLSGHFPKVVVLAVQVGDVCRPEELSAPVAASVDRVCTLAEEELQRLRGAERAVV